MPNRALDKTPQFEGEIDTDVVDVFVSEVSSHGYASADSSYGHHLVAWAPFENKGQVRTTTYNQNEKDEVQSFVQMEGGVNVGTEEWAGKRVVLLILDETLDE